MGFVAGNAQDIGSRPQQQDAFGFSDPTDRTFVEHGGFLGIVADGVGGLTHGSEASQSAVGTFLRAYHLKSPAESIPDALIRSLRQANEAVLRVATAAGGEGAGTTLAAAVLCNHFLYWITAGDTRIYLLHEERLTQISTDHTFGRELDAQAAQGKISREEAQHNPERGSLTSYLGLAEPKELGRNLQPVAIDPADSVMVCTDGFYRALEESEIVAGFRKNLQHACETLVHQALAKRRKGQDNLTVIALKQRPGRQKWPSADRPVKHLRRRLLALACVVVLCLFAGTGYWWKNRSANLPPHLQPPTNHLVANPAGGSENGPRPAASQPASATPNNAAPNDAPPNKAPSSNAASNNAGSGNPNGSGVRSSTASGHAAGRRRSRSSANQTSGSDLGQGAAESTSGSPAATQQGSAPTAPPNAQPGTSGTTSSADPANVQPSAPATGQTPPTTSNTSGTQPNTEPTPTPSNQNPKGNTPPASTSPQPAAPNPANAPAGAQGQAPAPSTPTPDNKDQKQPPPAPPDDETKSPPNLAFEQFPKKSLRTGVHPAAASKSPTFFEYKDGQV